MNRVLPPKISVIVPVYNAARFLDDCISCLYHQGVDDMEIILVNDGSIDESLSICRKYAEKDPRIQLYDKPNGGQSSARNLALRQAKGQYIAFLDSDDSLSPNTLSGVLHYFDKYPDCEFIQFPLLLEAGHPTAEQHFSYTETFWDNQERMLLDYATEGQLSWRVCDKVFRRDLLEGLLFVEGLVYEDNLYCTEAILRASIGAVINEGCYIYNWNNLSTTHSPKPQSFVDMIDVHGRIYRLLKNSGQAQASAHILCLVAADMYAAYRGQGILRQQELLKGAETLRQASWGECFSCPTIPVKRRLKCAGMKLYSQLISV